MKGTGMFAILEADAANADVCFLIALILCIIATVVCLMQKAWPAALSVAAVGFIALGYLWLTP